MNLKFQLAWLMKKYVKNDDFNQRFGYVVVHLFSCYFIFRNRFVLLMRTVVKRLIILHYNYIYMCCI